MLADVCRFYGWTPEYCLGMPAFSFFAFAAQAKKVAAKERLQDSKLHIIPAMKFEYFQQLQEEYRETISPRDRPPVTDEPPAAMAWDDPNAQSFIRDAFSEHRRSKYGR